MKPTQQELQEMFEYDEHRGDFTHKVWGRQGHTGKPAGSFTPAVGVRILVKGKLYLGHTLAWFYHYGEWPEGFVKHRNGSKQDNRICNLYRMHKGKRTQ